MFSKQEQRKPSIKGNRFRPLLYPCRPVYNQGGLP
jgi:hypothetical protein